MTVYPYCNITWTISVLHRQDNQLHEFHKLSKKLTTPNSENFSLLHSNICSLQGNFDKLESLIDHLDYKFDVVALSETWETKGNASFTAGNLPGYQKVEGTKGSSNKGRCGFYIKNSIPYIQRKEFNTTHKSKFSEFETNWIEVIKSINQNIIIGVVCRHPQQKDTEFLNYMKQTLKTIDQEKKKVILTGDFNFNLLKFDKSKEVNEFLNYLTAKWYTPHILGPTRLTEHQQPSLIDNIFLNFNDIYIFLIGIHSMQG